MNTPSLNFVAIAHAVDLFLVLIVVVTVGLVLTKVLDLYLSKLVYRKPGLQDQICAKAQFGLTQQKQEELRLELEDGIEKLERGLPLLATISSTAPFIGLAGTVLHIMDALSKISGAALDISLISGPISTALFSTLLGLVSAVLASVFYNVFLRKLQTIEGRCERKIQKSGKVA